jgi:hypothetical protein
MAQGQNRMTPDHSRAGETHHGFNNISSIAIVAMHIALITNRLVITKRATFDTLLGICQKPGALATQILPRAMMGAAVDSNHCGNGPGFIVHSAIPY